MMTWIIILQQQICEEGNSMPRRRLVNGSQTALNSLESLKLVLCLYGIVYLACRLHVAGNPLCERTCLIVKRNPLWEDAVAHMTSAGIEREKHIKGRHRTSHEKEEPDNSTGSYRMAASSLGSFVRGLLQRSMVLAWPLEASSHHDSHQSHSWGSDLIGTLKIHHVRQRDEKCIMQFKNMTLMTKQIMIS